MAKMIDPDRLAHELERFHLSTGHLVKIQAAMEAATVEVPEIVRCKDCMHYDVDCSKGKRRPTCGEEGCSFE